MDLFDNIAPKGAEELLEQGFTYLRGGEAGKAEALMDQVLLEDPYSSPAYWGKGLCRELSAQTEEDILEAVDYISRGIVYSEDPVPAMFGRRGILYYKINRLQESIRDLNHALELDNYWAEGLYFRGLAYLSMRENKQQLEQSVSDLTGAIKFGKPFSAAYYWRAQALRQLDREDEVLLDLDRALELEPDNPGALNALAYSYENGLGLKQDKVRAFRLYRKAAEMGYVLACRNLAFCYDQGIGCKENAKKAAQWMEQAADAGDPVSQNQYGLRLLSGHGAGADPEGAVEYFKLAAENGFPAAICNLGECCENGNGIALNEQRAFELYQRAAELDYVYGRYKLGMCYYHGIGHKEDNDKAWEILKPLADEGYAPAQDVVGTCYEHGFGVQRNQKLAQRYFMMAYRQGNRIAAFHLASRYENGRGVKKSLAKAAKLYGESADGGYAYARYSLGRLHFEQYRYQKAAECFGKAHEEGETGVLSFQARALMRTRFPHRRLEQIIGLLEQSITLGEDVLYAAMLLRYFRYLGCYGCEPHHKEFVQMLLALLEDEEERENRSCAYGFLAQAYEWGLGVPRDPGQSVRYIGLAEKAAAKEDCACYLSRKAHMLVNGLQDEARPDQARSLVMQEVRRDGILAPDDILLLYFWYHLGGPGGEGDWPQLEELAEEMVKEEPNGAMRACILYLLQYRRQAPELERSEKRLQRALKIDSPYIARKIRVHLQEHPGTMPYPILTAEDIDAYFRELDEKNK